MRRMVGVIVAALLLMPVAAWAQVQALSEWDHEAGGAGQDNEFFAITADATKTYAAGRVAEDWRLEVLQGATGAGVWNDGYDRTGGRDEARAVHVGFGRVAVAGNVETAGGDSVPFVRHYDNVTQTPICLRQDGNGTNVPGQWNAVVQTSNRIIAGGFDTLGGAGASRFKVRGLYLGCGNAWAKTLTVGVVDAAVLGLAANATRVFAVGKSDTNGDGFTEWVVQALNQLNGNVLWTKKVVSGSRSHEARAVAATESAAYAAGFVRVDAGKRATIKAYNAATGAVLWEGSDLPENADLSEYNAVALSGDLLVTAGSFTRNANQNWLVTARSAATGAILWQQTELSTSNDEKANAVAIAGNYVLVAGTRGTATGTNWYILIYDAATGTPLYFDNIDEGDKDAAVSAAGVALPDSLARFYVAGALGDAAQRKAYVKEYLAEPAPAIP